MVLASAQAENIVRWLTEKEWMVSSQSERRHSGHKIYHEPITAGINTDQIHHGAAGVSVLLRFFRCVTPPPKPPGVRHCTIASGDCQFQFPCVFLTESLLAMNFKGSNMSYMGGSAAPSFSSVPYSATRCL